MTNASKKNGQVQNLEKVSKFLKKLKTIFCLWSSVM